MNRTITSLLFVTTAALLGGCANRSHEGDAPGVRIPQAQDPGGAAQGEVQARESSRPAVALSRRAHPAKITEVVPDPRGMAALTLDADGGVRLFDDVLHERVEVPLSLPVQDPAWMSIARSKAGFVAAFIDTAGGGRIARIEPGEDGGRWIPLFETPPTDPMLELHVLAEPEGGARILALGVDHRVRILDERGEVRAELDRDGFVPWQLRVAHRAKGEPTVLAVLAGPVRVQRIAIEGGELRLHGDAHTVALDRGPNRNDLELSPDGKTVLALMRRTARSPRFELEAIDLATGSRRIVAADSDVKIRPRVHALSGARVLLESGSGKGLKLDLREGTPWPPAEGTPDRDALPVAALSSVDLPGSSETVRMHAVVVAGRRFVPTAQGLVVDPIGEDGPARVLGVRDFTPTAVALDVTGERVAWSTNDAIVIETVSGEAIAHGVKAPDKGARLLAFVGNAHIVVLDDRGRAGLHRIEDGETIATASIPVSWGISAAGVRTVQGEAATEIVLSSLDPGEPVRVLAVTATGFGELKSIAKAERSAWPEAGKPRNMGSSEFLAAQGLPMSELGLPPAKVLLAEPDPSGKRMALAQRTFSDDGVFDEDADEWRAGAEHFVVTIVDRAAQKRSWSVPVTALTDLVWSADGTRVAITGRDGGLVLDAASGETVRSRRDDGVAHPSNVASSASASP